MTMKLLLTLTLLAVVRGGVAEKKQESSYDTAAEETAKKLHLLLNSGRPDYVSSEYWTAYINVSYPGGGGGEEEPARSDRAEVGRYSSGNDDEVTALAVEMISTNGSRTGCFPQVVANYPSDEPWIAVVSRGVCTFNVKIRNAIAVNASGVLVYDNVKNGALQSMKVDRFPIPSVFTYDWKGAEITELIRTKAPVTMTLRKASRCRTARHMPPIVSSKLIRVLYCIPPDEWAEIRHFWNWNATGLLKLGDFGGYSMDKRASVLFVSVSFLVLILISVAWLVFFYVQRYRYHHEKDLHERRLRNQAKRALALMSTSVLKNQDFDALDPCAICIDTFRVEDVVRILPCKHQFHKFCIDQWLLDKRTCPMCKMDILKHYGLEDADVPSEAEASAAQPSNAGEFV